MFSAFGFGTQWRPAASVACGSDASPSIMPPGWRKNFHAYLPRPGFSLTNVSWIQWSLSGGLVHIHKPRQVHSTSLADGKRPTRAVIADAMALGSRGIRQ